jgi:hypothetical protein
MARDPDVPPPSGSSPSGAPGQPQQPPAPIELYGIVSVARHVKDDGRALLLYTREEPEAS